MATRRRTTARKTPATRPSRARPKSALSRRLTPEVVRSIIGLTLLVLGAMTLIALLPRGEGTLTNWWTDVFAPWFGTMRWLAPFMLLLAGWWLEWGPGTRPNSGWGITLLGLAITYIGIAGAAQVLGDLRGPGRAGPRGHPDRPGLGTGRVRAAGRAGDLRRGRRFRDPPPTAHQACRRHGPLDGHDRRGIAQADPGRGGGGCGRRCSAAAVATNGKNGRSNGKTVPAAPSPGQTGAWGDDENAIPTAIPSKAQTSNTFAPARGAASATLVPLRPARDPDDVTDAGDSPLTKDHIEYILPPITVLEDVADPGPCRRRRGGPRPERGDHRQEAGRLRDPGPDRRPQRRTGRHPVRGPAGAGHQGQPDRGARRRPGDGARRQLAPDRGADPGQERGRHRDPEQGLQRGPAPAGPRGGRVHRVGVEADVRPRARRGRRRQGGRPGQDAAPADRRGDRLGQERDGQRGHHQPAVQGDPGRRPDDPDGPQAGRAGRLQRAAAPARPGHHRARAGQGRAQVGGQRDGGPLPAAGRRVGAQHPGVQRHADRSRGPDAVHRHHHRRAGRPDDARGQERRGPDRPPRPEGAGDRASTWSSPRSGRRSTS